MQLEIITTKLKLSSAEGTLLRDYLARISKTYSAKIIELSRHHTSKDLESAALLNLISDRDFVILLDEKGIKFSSPAFADNFGRILSSAGAKKIIFIVAGAHGADLKLKTRANLIWSFSDQVFPHKLFLIMLAEQIYRTICILQNHPYHHK